MTDSRRPRRLGVIGTLVWDTIQARDGWEQPVEEWGGIGYALGALAAALPAGWEVVPVVKVGHDLAEEALRFLREFPAIDVETGVRVVPDPTPRVFLRYVADDRRTEYLRGGVPPWEWTELAPIVRSCDALYVNFITGFELTLDTARALRAGYGGPTYADLHTLFKGVGREGLRVPRELPAPGGWLRSFDAVQMNECEFELLGRAHGDGWQLAAEVTGPELKLITVTLGDRGAAWVAAPDFSPDPWKWPATRDTVGSAGPTRSGRVEPAGGALVGDPTGCGDVWGATFFARLLVGDTLDDALATANRHAGRNVLHRGARGLHHHLLGRLSERDR